MTNEFSDHIDKFVNSLNESIPNIYYQAFDFSNVKDSRSELTKLNYDKNQVSFLNLEMVGGKKLNQKMIYSYLIRSRICFKYLQQFIVLWNKVHQEILVLK